MDKYKSPYGYPDEHMRLLGIIIAQWEVVEAILERALAVTMEHNPSRVALLTSNMAFNAKADLLTAYARAALCNPDNPQPDIWKRYTAMLETIKTAQGERNRYAHAKWFMKDGKITRSSIRSRGGKLEIIDTEKVTTEKLMAAADQIYKAALGIVEFYSDIGIDLAWPGKS